MQSSVIEFHGVDKKFVEGETTRLVLKNITGSVPEGETLALVGPSGAGKSTLLSLCNLLLTPDAGQVVVLGKEIREWSIPQLRRTVGMVFQTATVFPGTVYDNLNLGPKLRGEKVDDAQKWLHALDLPQNWLSRNAEELSGGQKQRIALARTLANRPKILLLDEVTSALDPTSTQIVESLIMNWRKDTGGTALWVTHHLHQARRQSTETWFLEDGELVETGPSEQLFTDPKDGRTRTFLLQQHGGDVSHVDSKDDVQSEATTAETPQLKSEGESMK
ncbi:phosphate ABC transporter ATP-binding protein [Alicyclobacillus sp. SO9]|uniref:ABC transporter ATP-binding protein n=1 Tax=Alicyclobacillus sp. SO9 TaxID=2665646 RepID=UPI001E324EB6|nr:phosphate ABC transporter ATP-binding protein [Alicyclobacillus sp. SO9]